MCQSLKNTWGLVGRASELLACPRAAGEVQPNEVGTIMMEGSGLQRRRDIILSRTRGSKQQIDAGWDRLRWRVMCLRMYSCNVLSVFYKVIHSPLTGLRTVGPVEMENTQLLFSETLQNCKVGVGLED